MWGQGMVAYTQQQQQEEGCKWFTISEMSFIDNLREEQAARAAARAEELNIDPGNIEDTVLGQMRRLPSLSANNGLPDIETLKAMYVHN